MSIDGMKILKWMSTNKRKDRIRTEVNPSKCGGGEWQLLMKRPG
jgi:hypothetical protein